MKKYYNRVADDILDKKLNAKGAVLVSGPKWCGKTETSKRHAKTKILLLDPDSGEENIRRAENNPSAFLKGKTPLLIDEWQYVPTLWNAVKFEVDKRKAFGQFILTGSVTPPKTEVEMHSGIGRIVKMKMRPMSLYESLDSSGTVSLQSLFNGDDISVTSDKRLEDYAFFLCRGGWPDAIGVSDKEVALEQAFSYVEALFENDINSDGKKRDTSKARRLLRSYSRHISSQATGTLIKKDMSANGQDVISDDTFYDYLKIFSDLYVIEEVEAWNPNIRSKARIQTSETRHLTDPSIATATLGLGPNDLLNDLESFGLFFESMCVRDLRTYAEYLNGEIYHYRDSNGLEVDIVVHLRNGAYGLIEVKLASPKAIDQGAQNLLKVASLIDTDRMKAPSFLMVLTASGYGYKRDDGVYVVPLSCLKY